MARKPRLDFEGAWHHVMNRGARREIIFLKDEHAGLFLRTLGETVDRFGIEIHAYSIMPNHYHLLVRSLRGNLSRAMRHLGACFTQDLNRYYGWDGPIFRGRFRNKVVHDESHLLTVATYIHLNPIRAGLARRLDQNCWTTHRIYLGLDVPPVWVRKDFILALAGGRRAFAQHVTGTRRGSIQWPDGFDSDTGRWAAGVEENAPITLGARTIEAAPVRSLERAEDVLARIVSLTGTARADLLRAQYGPGGNPARRFAVWALARGTEYTQAEIGTCLEMSTNQVALVLGRLPRQPQGELGRWIDAWLEQEEPSISDK